MNYAAALLWSEVFYLFCEQAVLVLFAGTWIGLHYERHHAFAVFYGGGVAMLSALLLGWQIQKISYVTQSKIKQAALHFSFSVIWRFIMVAVGLWGGVNWLHLPSLTMVIGFTAAQTGYFLRLFFARAQISYPLKLWSKTIFHFLIPSNKR